MSILHQRFSQCFADLIDSPIEHWLNTLPAQLSEWQKHGADKSFLKLCNLLPQLPMLSDAEAELGTAVRFGSDSSLSENEQKRLIALLKQFKPWRKGPFEIGGVHIDTEWRSDWKWERVLPHIAPLAGKTVLDVGCGSGYHLWRMFGEDAKCVIGIDPTALFLAQFLAIKQFYGKAPVHMLPLGIEQMPALNAFDTVFSMGVLYHRRDPIQFLTELKDQLQPGGQLVLETLVIQGDETAVLMPEDRYAQMRNVWYLPSTLALTRWLNRTGFIDVTVVDESITTVEEQRATEWMTNLSLRDFLDPHDCSKTIEGYPAPRRAVLIATKKPLK